MRFRGYKANDFEQMFALDEVCFEPRFRFSRELMREYAEAENAGVLLAEDGGALAGFFLLHLERVGKKRVAYLMTIDVAPAHRGQGLGEELMRLAEREAASEGSSAVLLHVHTGNAAAIRLYERMQYIRVATSAGLYGLDDAGHDVDAFVYRKQLAHVAHPVATQAEEVMVERKKRVR